MYFKRDIDDYLLQWADDSDKKPLLLRGARQVGKSTAVRHLGQSFASFVEVNFDYSPEFALCFENTLDPQKIINEIAVLKGIAIIPGKTLLFLDEIQNCPKAISSLRYFYENMPDLHVVATGSLLEFTLAKLPSFGVGRIRTAFLFPFSFSEFLKAIGQVQYLDLIEKASGQNPIFEVAHQKLIEFFRLFIIVGGMPEAVANYATKGDLLSAQNVVSDIVSTYQTDFAKYKTRIPEFRLNLVLKEVVNRVGQKFSYVGLTDKFNHGQIKEAIDMLVLAGLIYPVVHTSANGLPIGAETNSKKTKYLVFDTAIYMNILGYKAQDALLSTAEDFVNNGAIAELFAGIEFIKAGQRNKIPELFYWHREAKNADAEVDYVIQNGLNLFPIEVKAGKSGKMKSLFIFLKEKQWKTGIKVSLENFADEDLIKTIPLYAVRKLFS